MHSFLGNLTDLRHKMLAITVIYVPKEGLNVDVDEAQHDKELIKRLEGSSLHAGLFITKFILYHLLLSYFFHGRSGGSLDEANTSSFRRQGSVNYK